MFLAEEIVFRDNIKFKINELSDYLVTIAQDEGNNDSSKIDETVNALFKLFEECQQREMLIDRANRSVKIQIGNSELLVADAINIRNTINKKIGVLTDLINICRFNSNSLFNIHDLIKNRDKLIEEFSVLDNAIEANNWRIKIGE